MEFKKNTLENSINNDETGLSIFDKIFDNTSDNIEVRSLGIMHLSSASLGIMHLSSASLHGRHMEGKGKGAFGARETRRGALLLTRSSRAPNSGPNLA